MADNRATRKPPRNLERRFDPEAIRRRTTRRLLRYGVSSLVLALLIIVVGVVGMTLAVGVERTREEFDWGMMESITGLASIAVVVGGAVFVAKEYIDNEMQGTLIAAEAAFNMYRDIYERITDSEETAARRWIILNITPLDPDHKNDRAVREKWLHEMQARLAEVPDDWDGPIPPGQMHLKRVLNNLDFLGYVEQHYWEMEDDLVEWLSPMVAKVWERVEPYVEHEGQRRAEPDFYKSAREFGRMCVDYRHSAGYRRSRIIDQGT